MGEIVLATQIYRPTVYYFPPDILQGTTYFRIQNKLFFSLTFAFIARGIQT